MDEKYTTNYGQFKQIVGNREIYKGHVARLIASIEKNNMLEQNPIIVNEKMEVVDGQHRLEAAKALGVPIFFTIVPNASLIEIQLLNANNREWDTHDYLNSYIALGNRDYMKVKEFADQYRISVPITIMILSDQYSEGRGLIHKFRVGNFAVKDMKISEEMASLVIEVRRHSPDMAFAHRACIQALRKLIDIGTSKQFVTKLNQYQTLITRRASMKDYLRQFDNIISAGHVPTQQQSMVV